VVNSISPSYLLLSYGLIITSDADVAADDAKHAAEDDAEHVAHPDTTHLEPGDTFHRQQHEEHLEPDPR
jgi:hypothetical protein